MTGAIADIPEASRAYMPVGAIKELFYAKDPEILVEGPAGTGKSLDVLNKIHLMMLKYPRSRGLLLRKTRKSLSETTMVTYESKVCQEGLFDLSSQRSHRANYVFPNGSELVIGGLDDPTKIMSSEYDVIFIDEAVEATLDDWEMCSSRLRNYRIPYQQILGCVNPSAPTHWLNLRANEGRIKRLVTRHRDNPAYFDLKSGTWTEQGKQYMAILDRLTGVRRERLLEGKWSGAEGRVYEDWDAAVHVVKLAVKRDYFTQFVGAVDWGFTHPGVLQVWGIDHDGRMILVHEVFQTEKNIEWWVDEAKKAVAALGVSIFTCDSARPDHIDAFKKAGINAIGAFKGVEMGIQAVQARLKPAGDGKPRLLIMDDCLASPDQKLVAAKKPFSTAQEFDSYVWDRGVGGVIKETPVKEQDDGMDCLRYAVAYVDKLGGGNNLVISRGQQ